MRATARGDHARTDTEGSPNYRHPDLCFAQAGDPSAHNLGCLAVSGTWTINLTFICGKAIHTAVIAQKDSTLTGTYKGEVKEGRLFGRVKGNAIEFTGSLRVEAQGISFRYTGTIEGDTRGPQIMQRIIWGA